MRYLIAAAIVTAAFAGPVHADSMKNCATAWKAMSAADQAKNGPYTTYSKMCLAKGYTVPATSNAMTAPAVPAGATGMCKDGTYTMSKTHAGACSGHGGVAKWL